MTTPILMLGAGRMGGAMLAGWRKADAFSAADVMIRDPQPDHAAAAWPGVQVNPQVDDLIRAKTVVLSVKPQIWREVAGEIAGKLAPDAVIVSVAAGIRASQISDAFGGRKVARAMPTTASAIGQGTASLYAEDAEALARAHRLFEPLGTVVDLADEALIHAATGVSGSAPAYLYAFIEALEGAGVVAGLKPEDASRLARATITGAAALLAESGEEPGDLRRQVTSPGGTTQAAMDVLMSSTGLPTLLREAVTACMRRSKELGA